MDNKRLLEIEERNDPAKYMGGSCGDMKEAISEIRIAWKTITDLKADNKELRCDGALNEAEAEIKALNKEIAKFKVITEKVYQTNSQIILMLKSVVGYQDS